MEIDEIIVEVCSPSIEEDTDNREEIFEQFCIDFLKEKGYKVLEPVAYKER